jgi:hypothetical protein
MPDSIMSELGNPNGYYRNDAILTMRLAGLIAWKEQVDYHRRSPIETTMFWIKMFL